MSHTQTSHASHREEPCLTYRAAISMTWSHVSHTHQPCHASDRDESCLTHRGVMSHIESSHIYDMESCLTYTAAISYRITNFGTPAFPLYGVMPRLERSHVSHKEESCLIYRGVVSDIQKSHVSHREESCFIQKGNIERSRVSHTEQPYL